VLVHGAIAGAGRQSVIGLRFRRQVLGVAVCVTLTVSVAAMHEDVHQWASREQEPRQKRKHVRAMLGHKEECANEREYSERYFGAGCPGSAVGVDGFSHGSTPLRHELTR